MKQQTKLPDGSEPSFEQLEEAFLNLHQEIDILKVYTQRLNQELADARYTIKKLKGSTDG